MTQDEIKAKAIAQAIRLYGGLSKPPIVRMVTTRPPDIVWIGNIPGFGTQPHIVESIVFPDDPKQSMLKWMGSEAFSEKGLGGQRVRLVRNEWMHNEWTTSNVSYDERAEEFIVYGYMTSYRFTVWVPDTVGEGVPDAGGV